MTDAMPAHLSGDGPVDETVRASELSRAFAQPRTAARGHRWQRMVILPAVATGVASVAAISLAVSGGGHPLPSKTTPMPPNEQSAFQIAADNAELQPTGKFWYTDQISGQSYLVKAGYAITGAHSEYFEWTGVKEGDGNLLYGRDLPARPLTADDAAAWRKAGSPSSFRVWSNDHFGTYTTKAGAWQPDKAQARAGGRFYLPGNTPDGGMTAQQLQSLPTDPAALAKTLFEPPKAVKDAAAKNPAAAPQLAWMYDPAHTVLQASGAFSAPLPPQVRAGLMRALASQPGVQNLGTVTDPLGRPAIAVGADWSGARPTIKLTKQGGRVTRQMSWEKVGHIDREELLFDAKTGAYLGEQKVLVTPGAEYSTRQPGFVINYNLMRASGWTDTKPAPPSALPFS
jgi:hypothetical protein